MSILKGAACLIAMAFLGGCAGSARPPAVGPGENVGMPHFLETFSEARATPVRFPRGSYALVARDKIGYYYRSADGVVEGSARREGGIFVGKNDQRKLRGYIYIGAGIVHVGDLSSVPHQFHD